MTKIRFNILKTLITYSILLVLFSACSKKDDSPANDNVKLSLAKESVTYEKGAQFVTIESNGSWVANLEFPDNSTSWCTLSPLSGSGNAKLSMIYTENTAKESRSVVITVIQGSKTVKATFTQKGYNQNQGGDPEKPDNPEKPDEPDKPQQSFGYAELPAYTDNADYQYVTHYANISGKRVRNYSLCYDKKNKGAIWIAYPLHSMYLGSQKRTDAWNFDPDINYIYQPNCVDRSYSGSYDRGHQIPSGDRTANFEVNSQTFYMSNMLPQLSGLNQYMWAQLEIKVRGLISSDTLYVVTGAYFGGNQTTRDGAGNQVSLPSHFFKVLLSTKSGRTGKAVQTCTADELKAIGFWVEHKSYGDIQPPAEICTTVDEIEKKTGIDFFASLPKDVQDVVEATYRPKDWGFSF